MCGFPPELGTVERAMKAIDEGRYVLIPYSDHTHGQLTHYYAAVWKPYPISFMDLLGCRHARWRWLRRTGASPGRW